MNVPNSVKFPRISGDQVGQVGQVARPSSKKFRRASELRSRRTSWLWTDHIPLGNVSIFEGLPGHGKSAVVYDLCTCVTCGVAFPFRNSDSIPGGVVLVQGEDDHETTVIPSLTSGGADLEKIVLPEDLVLPDDMDYLEAAARDVDAKLIVIDPLSRFVSTSLSSEQNARKILTPLMQLAERCNLSVILVRHPTKSNRGPIEYRGAGSVAIVAAARMAFLFEPTSFPNHYQIQRIMGLANPPPQPFETYKRDDETIGINWLPLPPTSQPQPCDAPKAKSKVDEAADFLFELLGNGPVEFLKVVEAAKSNDQSMKTVRDAKKREHIDHWTSHNGQKNVTYWELPKREVPFFVDIARVLKRLLDASRVVGHDVPPYVSRQKDRVIVVKNHINGDPKIELDISPIEGRDSALITIEDGRESVSMDIVDPNTFGVPFTETMAKFNLYWKDGEYERLTFGP